MTNNTLTGTCLCGSVAYEITGNLGIFQYCHCSRCRKFTGSAFAANMLVAPDNFRWLKGADHVRRHEHESARHFATSFCSRCGSSLPWLAKSGRSVVVPAGTLDDDPELRPFQNVFKASQASWFVDPDTLPTHDELPPRK